MESRIIEQTVANIFTNLLNTVSAETPLTCAKVQAIAETSVNYAFILYDVYKSKTEKSVEDVVQKLQKMVEKQERVETQKVLETKKVEIEEDFSFTEIEELVDIKKVNTVDVPVVKRGRGRPKGFSPKKKQVA